MDEVYIAGDAKIKRAAKPRSVNLCRVHLLLFSTAHTEAKEIIVMIIISQALALHYNVGSEPNLNPYSKTTDILWKIIETPPDGIWSCLVVQNSAQNCLVPDNLNYLTTFQVTTERDTVGRAAQRRCWGAGRAAAAPFPPPLVHVIAATCSGDR